MIIKMDRFTNLAVAAGTDVGLCAWAVPEDGVVLDVKASCKIMSGASLALAAVVGYAVDGWFFQIPNDFHESAVNAILDGVIPKYTAALSFDFDTETANAAPGYEPGEIRNDVLAQSDGPQHIYQRRKFLGFADGGPYHVTTEHTVHGWHPRDRFSIQRSGPMKARGISGLAFVISSPDMDALTTETKLMPTFGGTAKSEWAWLKYLDQAMELAVVQMLGLTETGAETPYTDLLDFIEFMISSANVMTTALTAIAWTVFMAGSATMSVPGRFRARLSSD